jgi:hypothetical protein
MATEEVRWLFSRREFALTDSYPWDGGSHRLSKSRALGSSGSSGLGFGRGGFEPPLTGPEPVVLPLDDLPDGFDGTRAGLGNQDTLG